MNGPTRSPFLMANHTSLAATGLLGILGKPSVLVVACVPAEDVLTAPFAAPLACPSGTLAADLPGARVGPDRVSWAVWVVVCFCTRVERLSFTSTLPPQCLQENRIAAEFGFLIRILYFFRQRGQAMVIVWGSGMSWLPLLSPNILYQVRLYDKYPGIALA